MHFCHLQFFIAKFGRIDNINTKYFKNIDYYLLTLYVYKFLNCITSNNLKRCMSYTHFTPVYRIRRKRMVGSFPLSLNDKRCLPFIIDRQRRTSFHSLPSNFEHRCELGIKYRVFHKQLMVFIFFFLSKYLTKDCQSYFAANISPRVQDFLSANLQYSTPFSDCHTYFKNRVNLEQT